MRGAVVVSDLSVPPQEGLHEQLLATISMMAERFDRVDLFGFSRSEVPPGVLRATTGIGGTIRLERYSGSSVFTAIGALFPGTGRARAGRRLRRALASGGYDLVLADGPLAAAAVDPRGLAMPVIMSWVDPGSRRFARLAGTARTFMGRLRSRAAALAYTLLEVRARSPHVLWHVVSPSDSAWLQERYQGQPVVQIPVALLDPPAEMPVQAPKVASRGIVPCDLRLPAFRDALRDFRVGLEKERGLPSLAFVVVGRAGDGDVPAGRHSLSFRSWVPSLSAEMKRADFVVLVDSGGTGLKNRTIQAVCSGIPVVGTFAAFEGLPNELRERHLVVASPAELASALATLVSTFPQRVHDARDGAILARQVYGRHTVASEWQEAWIRARDVRLPASAVERR